MLMTSSDPARYWADLPSGHEEEDQPAGQPKHGVERRWRDRSEDLLPQQSDHGQQVASSAGVRPTPTGAAAHGASDYLPHASHTQQGGAVPFATGEAFAAAARWGQPQPGAAAADPAYDPPAFAVPEQPTAPASQKTWQNPVQERPLLADSEAQSEQQNRVGTAPVIPATHQLNLVDLLHAVIEQRASDLHVTVNAPPTMRIHGELVPQSDYPVLDAEAIQNLLYAILTQRQRELFEENLELDFAYTVPGAGRFRVNLYKQRNSLGAAFRLIPFEIKPLEELGVPASVAQFASLPRGFVLVTGPTGSGKSTTLASLIDLANRTRKDHILTVEDPIEFLHAHQSCLVNQREVGEDTYSFAEALKHALRQDPDIILVGELRDLETISVALTAAETGHLVFATLHTQDAPQTVDRLVDVFPAHQQEQIRVQLAGAIQGVVTQTLCKRADGKGRAVATEVLVATPGVRNMIREGKTHQIHSAMQAGAQHGMHTLDQHLADLVKKNVITFETAQEKCRSEEDLARLLGQA